jgi:hypothetical protein
MSVGTMVGLVGTREGMEVALGIKVGCSVGSKVGACVCVGTGVGPNEGCVVGAFEVVGF